ncbi:MAG: ATP-dependent DNA helicase DinG [Glomeribacter sp. 1016415]|nr:ATP-dependent DNA helicase DinG [Glomeribacter sp. 1016415]
MHAAPRRNSISRMQIPPHEAEPVNGLIAQHNVQLEQLFAADGSLARKLTGYRPRAAQLTMAQAVAATIEKGAHSDSTLLVEAGTGTGKTFAYLIPAILWGGKVILSTGTKHLQDQLFARDIPLVRDALNAPVSVAILKGRANYICHYYLHRTAQSGSLPTPQDAAHLREIIRFAKITHSGDKAEIAHVPESAPIWASVTSTRENCLGQECAHYKECFVMQARREAQQADIVVVNHHLFFADIMLREGGVAELLPSANTIIFDEAHQLPGIATLFFGDVTSTNQFLELARDITAEGLQSARDAADWVDLGAMLTQAARDVRLAFEPSNIKLPLAQLASDHPLHEALATLSAQLDTLILTLAAQAERAESLAACLRRACELHAALKNFQTEAPTQTDKICWIEVFAYTVQLHITPLSIAPIFEKQRAGTPRAWIFTSATLSVKGDFKHYAAQMGLAADRSISLPSPFDYAQQALLYVPQGLPQPAAPNFIDALWEVVLPVLEAAGGRAFVLCTTLRAVNQIAQRLRAVSQTRAWNFPLLVQGEASRGELLERFQQSGNAILVGSQSFWEGVDVRGGALSLVIIDKLPFAPPDDPVLAARLALLEQQGLSPFVDYQLPQAVIALKQGAGRLIRAETDRGVLMICDARLVDKPYGRRIWQSLPAFKRTRDLSEVQAFFDAAEGGE